jgi:protein SCO1/2
VLTDTSGHEFRLSDHQGSPILLYFGYSHCPDVCPATLADMKWIFAQLGSQAEDLSFVLVTVDPERDTPEVLRTYLDLFDPRFVGLTGSMEDVVAAAGPYGVMIEHATHDGLDEISHTARVFLIDGDGLLQTNYSYGTPREEILADLRSALGAEP